MNAKDGSKLDGLDWSAVLGGGEIIPYAQPLYDLSAGRVVGAELLARWRYGGTVYTPDYLIPRLERCGLIHMLDGYMFEQACRILERWRSADRGLLLSVNQARVTIDQPDYTGRLEEVAGRYGFAPGSLIVEFTESTLCRHAGLPAVTRELRSFGFQVAVDDFGSGWSGLSLLASIQADWVKLDRCFLDGGCAERGRILLEKSLELARALGMRTVSEGVETGEQEAFLKRIGCDLAQGYRFGRPMPIGRFEALLPAASVPMPAAGGAD